METRTLSFDHYVSLGYNCEVSYRIQEYLGVPIDSYPFTWAYVHDLRLLPEALSDPANVLQQDMYAEGNSDMFRAEKCQISFHVRASKQDLFRQDGTLREEVANPALEELRARYAHLCFKWEVLCNTDERTLFVIKACGEDWCSDAMRGVLRSLSESYYCDDGGFRLLIVCERAYFDEERAKTFQNGDDRILFAAVESFAADSQTDTGGDIAGWMRALEYADRESAGYFSFKNKERNRANRAKESGLDKQIKVSVLIPVYNTVKTLDRCLASVAGQTLEDIEIICVDDGSDAATKAELQKCAAKDKRIRVLTHERNMGLLYARKTAIEAARGDYCMILDSDDEFLPQACEKAYKAITSKRVDILHFGTELKLESDVPPYRRKEVLQSLRSYCGRLQGDDVFRKCFDFKKRSYGWNVWNKIYRTSILRKAAVFIPPVRCVMAEDFALFFMAAYFAKTFHGIREPLIRYYFGEGVSAAEIWGEKDYRNYIGRKTACNIVQAFFDHQKPENPVYADAFDKWENYFLEGMLWKLTCECPREIGAKVFDELVSAYTLPRVAEQIALVFNNSKTQRLAMLAADAKCLRSENRPIRTVGFFYHRLHNGGVERVLSELIPMFDAWGYKTVCFVEEENEKDYPLPENCRKIVLPSTIDIKGKEYCAHAKALYCELQKNRVDVMLYQAANSPWLLYDMLIVKATGAKFVATLHELMGIPLLYDVPRFAQKPFVLRLADGVQTIVRSDEAFLRDFGVNAQYIPNPFFLPAERTPAAKNGLRILWVGRLDAFQKRPEDALAIFAKVLYSVPQARLYIVGSSGDKESDEAFAKIVCGRGLDKNVELCGFVQDPSSYYNQCDVLLMTSRFEVAPMVFGEAMSYGLPVVAYEMPYVEFIRNGAGCICVEQGDINSAAKELVRVLKDSALRDELSARSLSAAQQFADTDLHAAWSQFFAALGQLPAEQDENMRIFLENMIDFCYNRPGDDHRNVNIMHLGIQFWKKYGFMAALRKTRGFIRKYGLRATLRRIFLHR